MNQITIYSLADGALLRTFEGPAHMVEMQLAEGEAAYDGLLPLEGCKIDLETGEPVYFTPPARADHEWNAERHTQVLSLAGIRRRQAWSEITASETGQARALRELALGDKTAVARLQAIEDRIAVLRREMSGGNETRKHSDIGAANE